MCPSLTAVATATHILTFPQSVGVEQVSHMHASVGWRGMGLRSLSGGYRGTHNYEIFSNCLHRKIMYRNVLNASKLGWHTK